MGGAQRVGTRDVRTRGLNYGCTRSGCKRCATAMLARAHVLVGLVQLSMSARLHVDAAMVAMSLGGTHAARDFVRGIEP